jgi:hypothetical protein
MAKISNPNVALEVTHEELAVIRAALQGAVGNWYFDTDEERNTACSLLVDFGG